MVRFLPLLLASTLGLCACGSVEPGQPPPGGAGDGDGRYTLTATVGEPSEGLVLATGQLTSPTQSVAADIRATLGMSFMLGGFGQELPFCAQGDGFADAADIPVDTEACPWNAVSITGNAPGLERVFDRDGYVVRDRSGALYRLLIVEHEIQETDSGNIGRVTFDVLAVAPAD